MKKILDWLAIHWAFIRLIPIVMWTTHRHHSGRFFIFRDVPDIELCRLVALYSVGEPREDSWDFELLQEYGFRVKKLGMPDAIQIFKKELYTK